MIALSKIKDKISEHFQWQSLFGKGTEISPKPNQLYYFEAMNIYVANRHWDYDHFKLQECMEENFIPKLLGVK